MPIYPLSLISAIRNAFVRVLELAANEELAFLQVLLEGLRRFDVDDCAVAPVCWVAPEIA